MTVARLQMKMENLSQEKPGPPDQHPEDRYCAWKFKIGY
jgi:hypothetical protein